MSADHHNHSSLSIIVGDSQQVITGLHRETTVQNIVTWLCKTNNLQGEHLLLEVWKGCATPLRPWEKLVESILHWGAETHNVTLKLVKSKSFRKPLPHKRRIWLEKRRKLIQKKFDSCSLVAGTQKVAMRHSTRISSAHWKCHQRHKDLIKKRLQRMVKKSHDALKELQIQVKADERASSSSIGEKKTEAEAVSFLNPYLQGEYITSKNKLSKEKLMRKDLEKHKKELERKTSNIQSEILSLETNIEGTQEKIDKEKELLDQEPQDIRSDHDYQVATQKFEDLQSHLKAKQKISQLQSSKIQDLLSEKSILENRIHESSEQIRLLRLHTYKNQEEEDREMV